MSDKENWLTAGLGMALTLIVVAPIFLLGVLFFKQLVAVILGIMVVVLIISLVFSSNEDDLE